MKTGFWITAVLLLSSSAFSQQRSDTVRFSGNVLVDLCGQTELRNGPSLGAPRLSPEDMQVVIPRKSPVLAGVLSLAVPGAGEFYSESYLKSAIFFAADVAVWALAYAYDHKGDVQTDNFQSYANGHYSVVQYAQYAQDNFVTPLKLGTFAWHTGSSGAPWTQINWSELNRMEQAISATSSGSYYSHLMPQYNSQQYYELIGKYPQFSRGWDDVSTTVPPDWDYINTHPSPQSLWYMDERGKANTYYEHATTFVALGFLNHVLSAVDAYWSATTYNHVHAEMGTHTVPTADGFAVVPVLKVKYTL